MLNTTPYVVAPRMVDVSLLSRARRSHEVPLLVDVRSPSEFVEGHIAGSLNLPLTELDRRVHELTPWRSGEVWVICRSGRRSAAAADLLSARGFRVVDVAGGVEGWKAAGYDVQRQVSSSLGSQF